MEQTIGKRIMQNRKRLGLTQDQLAEQLGVTAQAVSKWENDQSCPDIAMLPKLSEIFGITTDALLGRESAPPVHEAEVVNEKQEEESDGLHFQKGNWEFKWDSGRKDGLAFAILVLLVGGLTLASKILSWDASFWDILWPCALLVFGISGLFSKLSFFRIGCVLFGGYYLIVNLGLWDLELGSELVFPIVVLLIGISLLVDALRKPKKPHFQVSHNGTPIANGSEKTKSHYSVDGESFECHVSFGENHQYVAMPRLSEGEIHCSFGELTVDLSGCEEIADGCQMEANCSFGELILVVPAKYRVDPESSTAFASLSFEGQPNANPDAAIHLDASVSFGEITVKYI